MATTEPAPSAETSDAVPDWRQTLLIAWFAAALPLAVIGAAVFALFKKPTIADPFFFQQDLPVILVAGVFLLSLRFVPRTPQGSRLLLAHPKTTAIAVAGLVAAIGAAGWFVVFHAYSLSMDEFMAAFDASIFAHGRPTAQIPAEWRPFAFPLQPQFVILARDGAHWASVYLPVNAAVKAALSWIGLGWAANAFYSALSVVMVFALARRLWPTRPDAAVVAALLLATSSQLLVTGMTGYAMPAHLALNLVWLWLFLNPDWRSQAGAVAVAAAACGLHQLVFHPLFAGPFVLGLWLQRRWARAAFHTVAYAAIGIFWLKYWNLAFPEGADGALGASDPGVAYFAKRIWALLGNFNLTGLGLMAKNLVRFIAWQNPLLPALALTGAVAAIRAEAIFRALAAGIALLLVVVWVLLPFQGHGWGYRYLHGFLGGVCLFAAFAWVRLSERLDGPSRDRLASALCLSVVFSLVVLAPIHAVQAEGLVRPYAAAARAIDRTDADVVLIDPSRMFYATDLVRNDAFLRNRPKQMDLGTMTEAQIRDVCHRYRVALFERADGQALGIDEDPAGPTPQMLALRSQVASACGARLVPIAR